MLQQWDKTSPLDTEHMGNGAEEIRTLKEELQDHLSLDHHMNDVVDPLEGNCSGYHKKVTLYPLDEDPTPISDTGVLYTKLIDGVIELFFIDETTGTVNQITEQGVLSLNTLANNIDADGKSLLNVGSVTGQQTGTVTGDTTDESDEIVTISDITVLSVGMRVSGTGIPVDTRIIAIDSGASTIQLSNACTATGTTVTITYDSLIYAKRIQATTGFEGLMLKKDWSAVTVKSRTSTGSIAFTVHYPCLAQFEVTGISSFEGHYNYSEGHLYYGTAGNISYEGFAVAQSAMGTGTGYRKVCFLVPGTYYFYFTEQGTGGAYIKLISSYGYNGETVSEVIS